MYLALHILGVIAILAGLTIFSYFDRIYREMGRVTTGRIHKHLEVFEAEIEPHLGLNRRRYARETSHFRRLMTGGQLRLI